MAISQIERNLINNIKEKTDALTDDQKSLDGIDLIVVENIFINLRGTTLLKSFRKRIMQLAADGRSIEEIVRPQIREIAEELKSTIEDRHYLKAALDDLWKIQKNIYQGIVRTEIMNANLMEQLQIWKDEGYTRVIRHCFNDPLTCPKCRKLDGTEWAIDELILLDYPQTDDPKNPGKFFTHPNCRDWFSPKIIITGSEINNDLNDNLKHIKGDDKDKSNVPSNIFNPKIDVQFGPNPKDNKLPQMELTEVEQNIRRYGLSNVEMEVVYEIVEDPRWQAYAANVVKIQHSEYSTAQVDAEVKRLTDLFRNKMVSVMINNILLLDAKSKCSSRVPFIPEICKKQAEKEYVKIQGSVRTKFGLICSEIMPTSNKNANNEEGLRQYFINGYCNYVLRSWELLYTAPGMYSFLKEYIFSGQEYIIESRIIC